MTDNRRSIEVITISAFADEIDPSLKTQMDACQANGIKCIDVTQHRRHQRLAYDSFAGGWV